MADIVSQKTRSRMMAGIKGANTKPELILRCGLHKRGFRYKLNDKSLQGKPDLVFPKYRAVLFAHGCFWHGHNCHLFKWPKTREKFWRDKINGNMERDKRTDTALEAAGWRVARIWECSLKGKRRLPLDSVFDDCAEWLLGNKTELDVSGHE